MFSKTAELNHLILPRDIKQPLSSTTRKESCDSCLEHKCCRTTYTVDFNTSMTLKAKLHRQRWRTSYYIRARAHTHTHTHIRTHTHTHTIHFCKYKFVGLLPLRAASCATPHTQIYTAISMFTIEIVQKQYTCIDMIKQLLFQVHSKF